jgi:hypothetical protein
MADDRTTLERIHALVEEEHQLRSSGEAPPPERLREIEEMLDQCWDLLRQRRAHREFAIDPDDAMARPIETVEGYEQ